MHIGHPLILAATLLAVTVAVPAFAGENGNAMSPMEHRHMMSQADDTRMPLDLPPQMRQHQLANMRSHLEAVQAIIGLIGQGDFEAASGVAHSRLGLTEEMKRMCGMFRNEEFRNLGLRFHESADALGEVLKTQDLNASLNALHDTMTYCVQCHATFRQ